MSCDICLTEAPTLSISTSGCGCCDAPADVCMDCARTRPLRDLLVAMGNYGRAVRVSGSDWTEIEPAKLAAKLSASADNNYSVNLIEGSDDAPAPA